MPGREQQSKFISLYITVFVNIAAFSMVFPLLPSFAKELNASNTEIGLIASVFALAQLIFSPFWGMLSDKFGRKPIILIGITGLAASFFLFGITKHIPLLIVARFLQGVFSGASLPTARAYAADITTKEERVKIMGRVDGFIALGVILGPALVGFTGEHSIALPFFGAALVALLNALFVLFLLPESLRKEEQRSMVLKQSLLQLLFLFRELKSYLAPLFLLIFLWSFALSNNQVNVPLLVLEKFNLGIKEIGFIFMLLGFVSAIFQFFLLGTIARLLGKHRTILWGLAVMGFGFLVMPFLPNHLAWLYGATAFVAAGSAVSRPILSALLSEETPEGQGTTMGIANAFESLGRFISPLIGGFLFGLAPFVPFLFSSVIIVLMLLFVLKRTNFLKVGHTG